MTILEAVREIKTKFRGKYGTFKVEWTFGYSGDEIKYHAWISMAGSNSISADGCSLKAVMAELNEQVEQFLRAPDIALVAAESDEAVAATNEL